jgi:hypothetical protein
MVRDENRPPTDRIITSKTGTRKDVISDPSVGGILLAGSNVAEKDLSRVTYNREAAMKKSGMALGIFMFAIDFVTIFARFGMTVCASCDDEPANAVTPSASNPVIFHPVNVRGDDGKGFPIFVEAVSSGLYDERLIPMTRGDLDETPKCFRMGRFDSQTARSLPSSLGITSPRGDNAAVPTI